MNLLDFYINKHQQTCQFMVKIIYQFKPIYGTAKPLPQEHCD